MYQDPKRIRNTRVGINLNGYKAALIQALVDYTGTPWARPGGKVANQTAPARSHSETQLLQPGALPGEKPIEENTMNLTDFQIAVLNDDSDEVNSLLMDLDRRTELEYFRKAADNFGFKLLEHRGTAYSMRRDLASIFGYSDESGLRKLCDRYGIQGVSLGTFGHNIQMYIPGMPNEDRGQFVRDNTAKALGLKRNDSNTVFLGWDGFLLAGARGESEQARKVFAYLLQMERAGRIAGGALTIAKTREHRIKEAERIVNIAVKYGKVPQPPQKKIGQYLDQILDTALSDHGQLCLFSEVNGQ